MCDSDGKQRAARWVVAAEFVELACQRESAGLAQRAKLRSAKRATKNGGRKDLKAKTKTEAETTEERERKRESVRESEESRSEES